MVNCKCAFLDGKEVDISLDKDATGSDLFDGICKYLNIKYRDPFGVVFRGGAGPSPYNWWLRLDKGLKRQIPGKCKVWEFAFLVKYYPKTITGMQEDVARYHVIMQIRQDLLTGRLQCPAQTMAHLCSYWLQAQYGDWTSRHVDMQLADAFRFVQKGEKETEKVEGKCDIVFEEQMMQIHKTHRGMSARDADFRFIKLASSLPNYGIHYYPMYEPPKEQAPPTVGGRLSRSLSSNRDPREIRGEKLTVGIGPLGIHQYKRKGNEIVYTWKSMRAVNFKENKIVLRMQGNMRRSTAEAQEDPKQQNKKLIIKEYCLDDMYQTKIIWQAIIEYHMFFRVADQQGLKGEQRKKLISSLKIKRTIPMLGEKKALPSPFSPTVKKTSRSRSASQINTGKATSPKEPVRRSSSQPRRPSSPLPVPRKAKLSASPPVDKENIAVYSEQEDIVDDAFAVDVKNTTSRRADVPASVAKPHVTSAASFASTPMSGKFLFPPRTTQNLVRNMSQTSTSGDEILDPLSDATDNTDVLCSPNILEKTFSYSDAGGINNIGYWEDALHSRGRSRVPRLQNASRSQSTPRKSSNYSSMEFPRSHQARRRSKPRIHDDSPIVIPADVLIADLKESKNKYDSYDSSSDFPMELDYEAPPAKTKETVLTDSYDRRQARQRQASKTQSLQALDGTRSGYQRLSRREQSTSPKRGRKTSPQQKRDTEQANADYQRARGEKRGYSERAYSESRLEHKALTDRSIKAGEMKTPEAKKRSATLPKRKPPETVPRRRNQASSLSQAEEAKATPRQPKSAYERLVGKKPAGKGETIPKMPLFVRSVS